MNNLSENAKKLLIMENNDGFIDAQNLCFRYDPETWIELVDKEYIEAINDGEYKVLKEYE